MGRSLGARQARQVGVLVGVAGRAMCWKRWRLAAARAPPTKPRALNPEGQEIAPLQFTGMHGRHTGAAASPSRDVTSRRQLPRSLSPPLTTPENAHAPRHTHTHTHIHTHTHTHTNTRTHTRCSQLDPDDMRVIRLLLDLTPEDYSLSQAVSAQRGLGAPP